MDFDDSDTREKNFHNAVRENIIFFLLFIMLYVSSYFGLCRFKRKEKDECNSGDEDEATVYRISLWICTFSMAVSVGAALLLPISTVSNEVLILYPNSYYVQWLNSSLIHSLWNYVFLCSNLALFILLPFAYFFFESEGFTGLNKGIMARVYETVVMLAWLALLVLGIAYILSAVLDEGNSNLATFYHVLSNYLPFLYSCISFLGVVLLLLCTPVGFARLFTVVGQWIVRPQLLRDVNEDYDMAKFEHDDLKRKIELTNGFSTIIENENKIKLKDRLEEVKKQLQSFERYRRASPIQRNLVYPFVMLLLLAITAFCALVVAHNMLELLVGIKSLPINSQQFLLGISSLSALGPIGAALEVVLIFYLIITSVTGLYTLPGLSHMKPKLGCTPMTQMIANCAVLLTLSSALPVLARTIGITNFDLLGNFGQIKWLGSFYVVLLYNLTFVLAMVLSLVNKFTATVRREIFKRLKASFHSISSMKKQNRSSSSAYSFSKDE